MSKHQHTLNFYCNIPDKFKIIVDKLIGGESLNSIAEEQNIPYIKLRNELEKTFVSLKSI
jgi:hypothetical protein